MTTNDEREALAKVISQSVGGWNQDSRIIQHTADAVLAWMQEQGYRRDATTRPLPESDYERERLREAADRLDPLSKKRFTSLDRALVRDAAYRMAEEHPEPTEPTDAEVLAALNAWYRVESEQGGYAFYIDPDSLADWSPQSRARACAALVAARKAAG